MRFAELLSKVSFDEIAEFIPLYDNNENSLASYKMHYDMLCQLSRMDSGDPTIIWITRYISDNGQLLLDAYELEGVKWNIVINYDIRLDSGIEAPIGEVAACCLWHTSFFGFTEEQNSDFINGLRDRIDDKQFRVYYMKYRQFLPSQKDFLELPMIHNHIRHLMKLHRDYKTGKKDKLKDFLYLKRTWRKWKRYEINQLYRERIKRIGKFLDLLSDRDKAYELFRVSIYSIQSYRTYVSESVDCLMYLRELIYDYGALQNIPFEKCVICITYSQSLPEQTLLGITRLILKNISLPKVEFVYRKNEDDSENIKIDLLAYR